MESENRTPTLQEMTNTAISKLESNEKGFFLMVEGSQIDWGGHGNDAEYVIREMKDFDDAVTDYHTGVPVALMAYGPNAIQFTGWHDNTDIGIKIAELMNFGEFPLILE